MNKKLFTFFTIGLTAVFFTSSSFAQRSPIDWADNDLKGKVKSVKVTRTYRNIEGNKTGKWQPTKSYSIVFDEKGHSVERLDFNEDGSLYYKTVYT